MPDDGVSARRTVDLDWRSVVAVLLLLGAASGVIALVRSAPRTVTCVALAAILVLALDPAVVALSRRTGLGRGASLALVVAGVAVVVGAAIAALAPMTIRQAQDLADDIPRVVDTLGDLPVVGDSLARAGVPDRVAAFIEELPGRITGGQVFRVGRSVADAVLTLVLTVLLTVALLADGPRLLHIVRSGVPVRHRARADRLGGLAYETVGRFAVGSLVVASVTGVVSLTAALLFGVPLAPLAALWAALWDLIPQVGGAVGGISLVTLALTRGVGNAAATAAVFVVWLQIRNNLVSPIITGKAVQLSPLATMVAVLVGVSAGGLLGAVVSVPLAGVAKAAWLEFRPPPAATGED